LQVVVERVRVKARVKARVRAKAVAVVDIAKQYCCFARNYFDSNKQTSIVA
jgi:hypothetical protein